MNEPTIAEKAAHVRQARQTRAHTCHWPGCSKQVKPAMWGCPHHWKMLPADIRRQIWNTYQPGQEDRLDPSDAYLRAARAARDWIHKHHPETRPRTQPRLPL